ncbi:MAG: hypothetical protein KJZ84_00480 [Bryobacteraceae bacterium]|nr:hypothetical protein [Bryobacteraceae bacterium]
MSYLGEAYLAGTSRQLKEYSIGRDVMSKPEDYDPRVDASVRVQIGKLRQRLDQYYREEDGASDVRITLPKGHFELGFESRVPPPLPLPRRSWLAVGLAAGLIAALIWGAAGWRRVGAPEAAAESLSPEMKEFWGPFVDSRQQLLVVLGSPLFIRFHNQYFRHPQANTWPDVERIVPLEDLRRTLGAPTAPAETRRWTPLGEAMAAFRLAMVLGPARPDTGLKRSTTLAWEDVKSNSLVFLGPPKFNQQLLALPVEQNFLFADTAITNLNPKPGELAAYRTDRDAEIEDIPAEYALVTRLRGIEGWGEVLVLASTTTEGTWGATEYVTQSATLREMLAKVKNGGALPDRYQVVLLSRFKEQVPIRTEYITHRVLP